MPLSGNQKSLSSSLPLQAPHQRFHSPWFQMAALPRQSQRTGLCSPSYTEPSLSANSFSYDLHRCAFFNCLNQIQTQNIDTALLFGGCIFRVWGHQKVATVLLWVSRRQSSANRNSEHCWFRISTSEYRATHKPPKQSAEFPSSPLQTIAAISSAH